MPCLVTTNSAILFFHHRERDFNSRPMPFWKELESAYLCLRCSAKYRKKHIPSKCRSSHSTASANPSPAHSTFVEQLIPSISSPLPPPFRSSTPTPTPAAALDRAPRLQEETRGSNGDPGKSQVSVKARNHQVSRRILNTQLKGIELLSRVLKDLSQACPPTACVGDALKTLPQEKLQRQEKHLINKFGRLYSRQSLENVTRDFAVLQGLDATKRLGDSAEQLVSHLTRNGLLKAPAASYWYLPFLKHGFTVNAGENPMVLWRHMPLRRIRKVASAPAGNRRVDSEPRRGRKAVTPSKSLSEKHKLTSTVEANALSISHLPRTGPAVPNLSHDLSRVLFNPGIYQLQDPRSRVYNFDPYLENIMPVSEFDFQTLKQYITSSSDETLRSLAIDHGKKYVGSSSSMTSTLAQFHFLLSQWREINTECLSRGFCDILKSFTILQRSPSAVFLRYQDGVYAIDADKEYDNANILMSLGRSMEKLLTQSPKDYERYRKNTGSGVPEGERNAPEAYQYSLAGAFLLRAQLDAQDPRLPGTGTFDLKTRAVASIRHNLKQHEQGFGYQIRTLFGDWESYEREYYDMMRSAFLKYSLQARMGQMDGIFVAFHNVERIFGFQYISLPEMDTALHGQSDTSLGDQEFRLSIELMNQILDRVTERFPQQSIRLQFETRDLPASGIYMAIYAEPMDESKIDAIQTSRKEAIDAFEKRLMNPDLFPVSGGNNGIPDLDQDGAEPSIDGGSLEPATSVESDNSDEELARSAPDMPPAARNVDPQAISEIAGGQKVLLNDEANLSPASNIREVPKGTAQRMELLVLHLRIQNRINGRPVTRPLNLTNAEHWSLDYSLEEESRESVAQAQYRTSKARRRAALKDREYDSTANFYLRRLREMAVRGAEWRKIQDEADAARKKVVLYRE